MRATLARMRVLDKVQDAWPKLIQDGWENTLNGLGGAADQARSLFWRRRTTPIAARSDYENIYDESWLARRVVQVPPDHALRKRPELPDVDDPDALWSAWEKLNSTDLYPHGALLQALYQGRLCGGSVLLPGFRFGKPETPAPEPGPRSQILWLDVARWEDLTVVSKEADANSPRYGLPDVFRINGDHPRKGYTFHASRAIFCEGAPRARSLSSDPTPWMSVLDPVMEELRRFDAAWQSVGHLLNEASIGVLSLGGLANMLTEKNKAVVDARIQLVRQGRSVARSVFLDAALNESYTRTEVNFGAVPQILEKSALQISGAINIPLALLFGQSAAGLNATGENDRAQFDDDIAVYQRANLRSKLQRLLSWVHGAPVTVEFRPIREMTETEAAALAKTQADTRKVYYDMEVIEAEHIVEMAADYLDLDPAEVEARKRVIVQGREAAEQLPVTPGEDEEEDEEEGEEDLDAAEGA